MFTRVRVLAVALLFVLAAALRAQTSPPPLAGITPPRDHFGAAIGDDYFLATYTQLESYWKTLAGQSDRMRLVDIGPTEEGRRQWMAVISAPENLASLDRYRDISRRLALAEGLSDEEARSLAQEGKAIVWIDGGCTPTKRLARSS